MNPYLRWEQEWLRHGENCFGWPLEQEGRRCHNLLLPLAGVRLQAGDLAVDGLSGSLSGLAEENPVAVLISNRPSSIELLDPMCQAIAIESCRADKHHLQGNLAPGHIG